MARWEDFQRRMGQWEATWEGSLYQCEWPGERRGMGKRLKALMELSEWLEGSRTKGKGQNGLTNQKNSAMA